VFGHSAITPSSESILGRYSYLNKNILAADKPPDPINDVCSLTGKYIS